MRKYKLLIILLIHLLGVNIVYGQGLYEKVTSVEQIGSGGVFIIVDKDYKYAMGNISGLEGKGTREVFKYNKESDIGTVNEINSEEHSYEIELAKVNFTDYNNYYSLKSIQGYIGKSDSENNLKVKSDLLKSNTGFFWNITITSDAHYAKMNSVLKKEAYIGTGKKDNKLVFGTYSNYNVYLFRKISTKDTLKIEVGLTNYATLYYSDKTLVVPEGVEAYTFKYNKDTGLYISHTYGSWDIIPAGTAVVLHGNPGKYDFYEVSERGFKIEENDLKGTDNKKQLEGSGRFYMLSYNKDEGIGSVGFYWGAENGKPFINGANKAYLHLLDTEGNAKKAFRFSETTGIKYNLSNKSVKNGVYYTIQGIKVMRPDAKGIYIVNGRKIIVK